MDGVAEGFAAEFEDGDEVEKGLGGGEEDDSEVDQGAEFIVAVAIGVVEFCEFGFGRGDDGFQAGLLADDLRGVEARVEAVR